MRKAEEFKTVADLGFDKRAGNYLLECFGSIERLIFEGRWATYLDSDTYHYVGADGREKILSRSTTRKLKIAMESNDLVRYDLEDIFRIGLFYAGIGFPYCYASSFASFKQVFSPSNHRLIGWNPYREANENYEKLKRPTPEQLAKLRAAIAARLSAEECVAAMLELSGHLGMNFNASGKRLASVLDTTEEEAEKIQRSARSKLMLAKPLPSFPIPDDEITPESFS